MAAFDRVNGDDICGGTADKDRRYPFEHQTAFGRFARARPVVVPVCAADMRGFRGVAAGRFSPVFFGGVTLADHSVHMRECFAAKKGREIDIISLL